jgi:hypothetical protein
MARRLRILSALSLVLFCIACILICVGFGWGDTWVLPIKRAPLSLLLPATFGALSIGFLFASRLIPGPLPKGTCRNCGYDLRATPGEVPGVRYNPGSMKRFGRILLNAVTTLSVVALLAATTGWLLTRWYSCTATKTLAVTPVQQSNKIVSVQFGIGGEGLSGGRATEFRPASRGAPPEPTSSWQWHGYRRGLEIDWNDPFIKAIIKGWRRWGFARLTYDDPFAAWGSSEGQPVSRTSEFWIVPWWAVLFGLCLLPAARGSLALTRRLRHDHPGRCRQCGYDLRATPERCPECGTIPAKA